MASHMGTCLPPPHPCPTWGGPSMLLALDPNWLLEPLSGFFGVPSPPWRQPREWLGHRTELGAPGPLEPGSLQDNGHKTPVNTLKGKGQGLGWLVSSTQLGLPCCLSLANVGASSARVTNRVRAPQLDAIIRLVVGSWKGCLRTGSVWPHRLGVLLSSQCQIRVWSAHCLT